MVGLVLQVQVQRDADSKHQSHPSTLVPWSHPLSTVVVVEGGRQPQVAAAPGAKQNVISFGNPSVRQHQV